RVGKLRADDAFAREIQVHSGVRTAPVVGRARAEVKILPLEVVVGLIRVGVDAYARLQHHFAARARVAQTHAGVHQHTGRRVVAEFVASQLAGLLAQAGIVVRLEDRKSTRLNSSHVK